MSDNFVLPPGWGGGDATSSRVYLQNYCYAFYALATTFVIARFSTRIKHLERVGFDDMFVLLSWLGQTTTITLVGIAFHYGAGKHLYYNITHGWKPNMWIWLPFVFSQFTRTMTMSSIVCLYHRLCVTDQQRRGMKILLAILLAQGLASFLVTTLQCTPVSLVYMRGPNGPGCINILAYSMYNIVWAMLVELCLAIAPIFVLRKLTFSLKKKIYISCMFALGIFNIGAAIFQETMATIAISKQLTDNTYVLGLFFVAEVLSLSLATVFVCIPPLAPYFVRSLQFAGFHRSSKSKKELDVSEASTVPITIGHGGPRRVHNDDSLFQDTIITQARGTDREEPGFLNERQDKSTSHGSEESTGIAVNTSHAVHSQDASEKV